MYIPGEVIFVLILTCFWTGRYFTKSIDKWKSGKGCSKCNGGGK
jgi:hypothetical protein